jgi:hypothetical protein
MSNKSYYIMGLPEAGKTTYLAALWHCLKNNENSLSIKRYTEDQTYLSRISSQWVDVEQLSRTKPEFEQKKITLSLKSNTQDSIEVSIPDLSGESFQSQYEKRETTQQLAEYVKQCDGILLFINPDITEPILISDIPTDLRYVEEAGDENASFNQRNPLKDPTQIQLVELLQFINYIRGDQHVKLAVIISAWDSVESNMPKLKDKPRKFIQDRLPILQQYLDSNMSYFKTMYYGISAQGGQLSDSENLLDKDEPYERIIVVDEQGNRSHDITLPLNMMVSDTNE